MCLSSCNEAWGRQALCHSKLDNPHTGNLLELPDEVLLTIFSLLDYDNLRQAVFVCQKFNGLSEPFLYHTVQVLHGGQALALAYSLNFNPRRARCIRELLISTKFGEENGLSSLPPFIAEMRNLQHLRLETPDCNSKEPDDRIGWISLQDRYERIFGMSSALVPRNARFLPNLKSCTIHFVDAEREIYSMTHYCMLFLHPNLTSLTISCASTDFPSHLLVPFQNDQSLMKSTRLEHLHLEECDIFSPTLAILLSFPRQLKSLKISEGVRYDGFSLRSSRLHGNVSPASFVEAIEQHCVESLESLSLSLGYKRHHGQCITRHGQYLKLTAFENMKYLEVDAGTANLLRSLPCDHQTWRRLPPNLETLKVFSIPLTQRTRNRQIEPSELPFEECFIRAKGMHGVHTLRNLIFVYEYYSFETGLVLRVRESDGTVRDANHVEVAHSFLLSECTRLQQSCKKSGIRLQLDMTELPKGYIPPYLFTEERPKTSTLWESVT